MAALPILVTVRDCQARVFAAVKVGTTWLYTRAFPVCKAMVTRINQHLALVITRAVGTMACAYVFLLLAIAGFPGLGAPTAQYVQWISQTVIQLVMLSVIMVGQRLESERATKHHHENRALHAKHAEDVAALHAKIDTITADKAATNPAKRTRKGANS